MNKKRLNKRVLSIVLAGIVGFTSLFSLPVMSYAVEDIGDGGSRTVTENEDTDSYLITSVEELSTEQLNQTITAYSNENPVMPNILTVKVATEETIDVSVQWNCDKTFNNKVSGIYTFTPIINSNYKLSEGIVLPKITVKVVKCSTKIENIEYTPSWTAKNTAYDTMSIYNGYGRILKLQMYSNGKWVTKKTYTLKNANYESLKVYYTNDWWKLDSSNWRIVIDANNGVEGYTSKTIKLTRKKLTTTVKNLSYSPSWTSRNTAYDTINISNGYGRKLKLQMYSNGKWVTKKTYTLKDTKSQELKVYYTNDWWKVESSSWRIVIDSSNQVNSYTSSTIKFKTKRYYQNPSQYVQIKNDISKHESGGYTLKPGYFGLKVQKVNRYFGIGSYHHPQYTSTTKAKVKAFQKKKGLKQTGYVDKKTWLAMGFSESSWYDALISNTDVNQSSSKSDHIEAMIDRAYEYLGSSYVYGASGTPSQGIDCSGLVIQGLYAAGVDPYPICSATHAYPENQYNSRKLYNYKGFKKVSFSNRKRGDLIFYKGSSGLVNHVAIYLGNNKIIEAYPNKVRISSVYSSSIAGVRRVFN